MAKTLIKIPEDLHDFLRIEKVRKKKKISEIIIETLMKEFRDRMEKEKNHPNNIQTPEVETPETQQLNNPLI